MGEKVDICANCRERRAIAAHGLCYKCYRAEERSADNPWGAQDKHNRALLKARQRFIKAITSILSACEDAEATGLFDPDDAKALRCLVGPYLQRFADGLPRGKVTVQAEVVNSEHRKSVNSSLEPKPEKIPEQPPDSRHAPIREFVKQMQRETDTLEQWDGRCARALATWLKASPTITVEEAQTLIRNRFNSDEPRGDPPWGWIPKLAKYSEGPLDKYGKTWRPDFRAGYEGAVRP